MDYDCIIEDVALLCEEHRIMKERLIELQEVIDDEEEGVLRWSSNGEPIYESE